MNSESRRNILFYGLLLLIFISFFIGCRTARFAVPAHLKADAPEMTVEGLQRLSFKESISFGPYRVTDVDRSWTKTESWGGDWVNKSKASQTYEFALKDQSGPVCEAQCATGVQKREMQSDDFLWGLLDYEATHVNVACVFRTMPAKKRWRMFMSQSDGDALNGVITDGKNKIQVRGSNKLQGSPIPLSDPTGYVFQKDSRVLGAVEVINKGAVWLHPNVKDDLRTILATASSALLLYRDISE